ncbi:hypothetical protein U9M48_018798, partial [Paspalum notatum var. saurae]
MDQPHCSPGVMSDCQRAQALRWTGGPPMDWRSRWTEAKAIQWTGGNARRRSAMGDRYTERRIGNGGVSPPMDREATPMDWKSRVPPWCSKPSAWHEGVRGRLWRLRLKTATQATQGL